MTSAKCVCACHKQGGTARLSLFQAAESLVRRDRQRKGCESDGGRERKEAEEWLMSVRLGVSRRRGEERGTEKTAWRRESWTCLGDGCASCLWRMTERARSSEEEERLQRGGGGV